MRKPAKIILKTNRTAGGTYYNAYVDGVKVAQIRVRGNVCDARMDDGTGVYQAIVDGIDDFASEHERHEHLRAACTAILAYLEPLYEIQDAADED